MQLPNQHVHIISAMVCRAKAALQASKKWETLTTAHKAAFAKAVASKKLHKAARPVWGMCQPASAQLCRKI